MNENLQLVIAPSLPAEKFQISPEAIQVREEALIAAAPIGEVKNAAQNDACFKARKRLKFLMGLFESNRKALKEPVIELGRQLDRAVAGAVEEMEREAGRLECLEREFAIAERNRVREEEMAQECERQRIEQERLAEIKRAQDEAAEKERQAQAAARAAEEAAAGARTKKQKEEAAKLAAEAEQKKQQAAQSAQQTELTINKINDTAEALTYRESRPVPVVKAKGQAIREEWEIVSINEHALYRARPDLARKIEFDLVALKAALDNGPLPGVVAKKGIKVGTRGGSMQTPAALAPPVEV
jgi:hypothetical protein